MLPSEAFLLPIYLPRNRGSRRVGSREKLAQGSHVQPFSKAVNERETRG